LDREPAIIGLVLLAPMQFDTITPDRSLAWSDVCFGLRDWARAWLRDGRLYLAAMTLAFCAAVERNVLHLGYSGPRAVLMANYLAQWLEITNGGIDGATR
jgi:hypothetical protein